MTRRIAVAILLTVWAILIAAGIGTYLVTRSVLLANLDDSIVERAAALPQVTDATGRSYLRTSPLRADDQFIARNPINQTLTRLEPEQASPRPEVLSAAFATVGDGQRFRTLTLKAYLKPAPVGPGGVEGEAGGGSSVAVPVTIVFRGSAKNFDRLMRLLAITLALCIVAGGVLSAGIAWLVARTALRPLHSTADVIGAIDDRALDRRIHTDKLPPELLPVGAKLNGMLERLEQAFAHRRRFLADAAHELRTPVAALITSMEVTLRRPREPDAYRQALETCLADARMLRTLVEALMTHARAELPSFDEPLEPVELVTLIEQTTSSLAALANERGVQLEHRHEQSVAMRTQPGRLRSVLVNLIGNAIEHNHPGGRVTIDVAHDPPNVRLSVTDTGPGIAPQHLPHLFDPFYRAEKSRDSGKGHLGLGLFLVKTHVDTLGGQISVRSEPNVGTTFELLLPDSLMISSPAPRPPSSRSEDLRRSPTTPAPTTSSRSS